MKYLLMYSAGLMYNHALSHNNGLNDCDRKRKWDDVFADINSQLFSINTKSIACDLQYWFLHNLQYVAINEA